MNTNESLSICERVLLDHYKEKHDALRRADSTTLKTLRLLEMQVLRDVLSDLGYGDGALADFLTGDDPMHTEDYYNGDKP